MWRINDTDTDTCVLITSPPMTTYPPMRCNAIPCHHGIPSLYLGFSLTLMVGWRVGLVSRLSFQIIYAPEILENDTGSSAVGSDRHRIAVHLLYLTPPLTHNPR